MNEALLREYVRLYWYAPSMGYWRAFEAEQLRAVSMEEPILDLGSGDGSFSRSLGLSRRTIGIDLSRTALRRCRRFWPGPQLVRGTVALLPFHDGAFQTVISNCVLEHIPPIHQTLDEVARVLKEGGLFALSVPSAHADEWGMGHREFAAHRVRVQHLNVWSADQWVAELTRRNLRPVQVVPYMGRAEYDSFLRMDLLWNRRGIARPLTGLMLALGLIGLRGLLARLWLKRFVIPAAGAACGEGAGLFILARKERSGP